ncbi:MAG TPA: HAD-IIB family hydrolase [Thermoleophilia bacterium]|nr:HAD-IIB family hydrolase [Thermoleophilia bacterium]
MRIVDPPAGRLPGPAELERPDLVASDLDGTLLPPSLEFLPATVAGVARLRHAGVPFVMVTGRMFKSARRMADRLGLTEGPIICYQGALLADLGTGAWLRHLPIPSRLAAEVVVACRELHRHVNVYVGDELYVEQDDVWARRYAEYAEVGLNVVDDLVAVVAEPPTKIVISSDPDDITHLLPDLQERWASELYVTRSLPHFIEVSDPRGTKSQALDYLCALLSFRRRYTVTCGDGLNDVDMIEWAGLGVVVAEATDDVRRSADLVVPRDRLGELFEALAAAPPPSEEAPIA